MNALVLETRSEVETRAVGRALGRLLAPGDAVLLRGELGAGKTSLAKGIVWGFGAAAPDEVTSPTFILVGEYGPAERRVRHLDAYRLAGADDLVRLGGDELFRDAVALVEWPERVEAALPRGAIRVAIEPLARTRRRLSISAEGARAREVVAALARQVGGRASSGSGSGSGSGKKRRGEGRSC